ncbi:MAG: DUF496 family protein [Fusobacterium sp. JB021]|nr:DUF496 family protein [Fusobacterium sp. JB020]MDP0494245.1 DUF496 family protein [Fusobacterium sp. JB021]MDP0505730.1 DUF496 family protein [Fusobacterium sp. JB019]
MDKALEIVRKARRKNKIEREIQDHEKKVRDNRKRVLLLRNLEEYIKPTMTYDDFVNIVENMKLDYEERVSDHTINIAELEKERKDIIKDLRKVGIKNTPTE